MNVCSRSSIIADHLFFVVLFPFLVTGFIIIFMILFLTKGSSQLFFIQERMGRYGIPFRIYKFQTLENGSDINRFTHFLRQTGLDELPQIANIIRGEMLLFGPRPKLWREIPYDYVADYQKYILIRHPGLLSLCMSNSGPGQSLYRSPSEMKKDVIRILLYERYEQIHWSPKLMFTIIYCCFRKILKNGASILAGNLIGTNADCVLNVSAI